jgi:hypothetical protein
VGSHCNIYTDFKVVIVKGELQPVIIPPTISDKCHITGTNYIVESAKQEATSLIVGYLSELSTRELWLGK